MKLQKKKGDVNKSDKNHKTPDKSQTTEELVGYNKSRFSR